VGLPHDGENSDESHAVFIVYKCEAVLPLEIKSYPSEWPWQPGWRTKRSIDWASKSWKF